MKVYGSEPELEEQQYFSLEQFNKDLWKELEALNEESFKKKEHNRYYYWEEEKLELMPYPPCITSTWREEGDANLYEPAIPRTACGYCVCSHEMEYGDIM